MVLAKHKYNYSLMEAFQAAYSNSCNTGKLQPPIIVLISFYKKKIQHLLFIQLIIIHDSYQEVEEAKRGHQLYPML